MKKIVVTLFLLMSFTLIFAQSSEHLKFKGVSIDGTLSEYVSKMKQAGFQLVGTDDGVALLEGEFAGYRGCLIAVSTLKSVNVVNTIGVVFPARENWSSLEGDYEHLKSMLTEKYGEPSDVVEKFQGYGDPQTDQEKWINIMTDNYTWYTIFETENGDIQLSLEKGDYGEYFVLLKYFDKINTEAVRSAAMEDL
ncbi:MAG: hypothetical protein IKM23_05910 [Bacteroidales bacterium]|nr:hypothetical protein [Bacteroidales bacterium]